MADILTLRKFEALSPFEIKDELIKPRQGDVADHAVGVPQRRPRQPELGRHHAARGASSCSASSPSPRASVSWTIPPASAACRRPAASPARLEAWLAEHADMPGADLLAAMVRFAVKTFGFDPRRLRPRAGRLDHRRQLPGARPHARPQRADRARVSDVGDVRRAAARRQVRPLRGRGRHGGDVLHLQVAEGQSPAAARRHHRARDADLHALSRDDAPGGLRPQGREDQGAAGKPLPVHRRGNREAGRSEDQGVLRREPRQSDRHGDEQGDDRQDRQSGQDQAPRPDAADRRRVRHLRRRFPVAARRAAAQHDRRLLLLEVFRLHRLAARASSRSTRTTSSTR